MDIIPGDKVKLDKENVEKDKSDIKSKKEAAEDLFSAHDFDITIDLGEITDNDDDDDHGCSLN